jgi:hypothetical protein
MSDPTEMAERHARVLAKLTELGLELACDLQAAALAAEDPVAKERLALAFHRVGRSVRQGLALEARLQRDLQRADREHEAQARDEAKARVAARKSQVGATIERLIWTEHEGEDAERLIREVEACLDEEALYDDFLDETVEAQIERYRRTFSLAAPAFSPPAAGGDGAAGGFQNSA